MLKNYAKNVIRLRRSKKGDIHWIIVILNKKKLSSHKQIEQLGFFKFGKKRLFVLNYDRLSYYLNKGFLLKKSVKTLIYKYTLLINKKKFFKKSKKRRKWII
jgi:ribosomal protein S16